MNNIIFSGIIGKLYTSFSFLHDALYNINFIKGSELDFNKNLIFLTIFPVSIYKDYYAAYYPDCNVIHICNKITEKIVTDDFYNLELIFYTSDGIFENKLKIDAEIHEILNNNGS